MLSKYSILLTVFLIFFNGDKPLNWSSKYKLTWEDFKGNPKENYGAVAVTASGITFGYNVKTTNGEIVSFSTTVEAQFHPENSWYLKDKASPYILAHEQLHFDITELHVRKLRKAIAQLHLNPGLRFQLKGLHLSQTSALKSMQNQYDSESENSINLNNQLKWEEFVKNELEKYKEFASK